MDKPALEPPVLFISDVHLGAFSVEENTRIETDLIQLIAYCKKNNIHIAILGDLFDYWMEYPSYIPELGKKLLERFKDFNDSQGPTLYITGNHDNWTRDHFRKQGFYLEHEQYFFSLNNHQIMALHGDGLSNPEYDLERPFIHRLLRGERFIKLFQAIFPPRTGIAVMKYFSRFTRWLNRDTLNQDKLNLWAKNKLEHSDIDIILCGHDHVPRSKQFSFGTYVNLGSFYKYRTMALYNNSAISLVSWEANTQSLTNFDSN